VSTVRYEAVSGGVCRITLDKPPANAIDERLLVDLDTALDRARAEDAVRAVVLTGAGAFFCSGFDFAAPRRDDAVATELYASYRTVHLKLLTLPKPTVALVNGHAIAGGLVLMLACDYRCGIEGEYRIGLTEVVVGASFPRAAFEIVRLRLSHAHTCELILGAALYPAREAVRLGVVQELLPSGTAADAVVTRAARLGGFPREAYAHAKAALIAEAVARIEAETDAEALQTMSVWVTPESRAARAQQRAKLGVRS
jgi:enoyl-CoA hydratase/carnithine racemase